VIAAAAKIVRGGNVSYTLRQLFYALVVRELIRNAEYCYKRLSTLTAQARRHGSFPELIDLTRTIDRPLHFTSPEDAVAALAAQYRRDRTEGQAVSLYIGVEKRGLQMQLRAWFENLGIPILALGGYTSQSYADEVRADILAQDRPAVLAYAGDFDASGEDIDRDFIERVRCWDDVARVALTPEQVREYDLPPQPGKATDSRANRFIARHGENVQVELDALPPEVLRDLYQGAINEYWDMSQYEWACEVERAERASLHEFLERWRATRDS
jgi:hypothetical protein